MSGAVLKSPTGNFFGSEGLTYNPCNNHRSIFKTHVLVSQHISQTKSFVQGWVKKKYLKYN